MNVSLEYVEQLTEAAMPFIPHYIGPLNRSKFKGAGRHFVRGWILISKHWPIRACLETHEVTFANITTEISTLKQFYLHIM